MFSGWKALQNIVYGSNSTHGHSNPQGRGRSGLLCLACSLVSTTSWDFLCSNTHTNHTLSLVPHQVVLHAVINQKFPSPSTPPCVALAHSRSSAPLSLSSACPPPLAQRANRAAQFQSQGHFCIYVSRGYCRSSLAVSHLEKFILFGRRYCMSRSLKSLAFASHLQHRYLMGPGHISVTWKARMDVLVGGLAKKLAMGKQEKKRPTMLAHCGHVENTPRHESLSIPVIGARSSTTVCLGATAKECIRVSTVDVDGETCPGRAV